MFDTFIVQPILNLLFVIWSFVPGDDFGVTIIIFTVIVRMALWPLVKKQLHQTRAMRQLQPEIKKIKSKTKGDRQKEGELLMELYREKGVSPFGSIGVLLLQLPILFGLFRVLRLLSNNPEVAVDKLYGWVTSLPGVGGVVANPGIITHDLTQSFGGLVDLSKSALDNGSIYWPLMIVALAAGILQYIQTKQLTPDTDESKGLRDILREEASGEKQDQKDINAAVGKNMRYAMPIITIFFAASFPGALALYWATGSGVAVLQQRYILSKDVEEMEEVTDNSKKPVSKKKPDSNKVKKKTSSSKKKKG